MRSRQNADGRGGRGDSCAWDVAELVEGHTNVHAGRSTPALLEFEQAYASSAKEMLHFAIASAGLGHDFD